MVAQRFGVYRICTRGHANPDFFASLCQKATSHEGALRPGVWMPGVCCVLFQNNGLCKHKLVFIATFGAASYCKKVKKCCPLQIVNGFFTVKLLKTRLKSLKTTPFFVVIPVILRPKSLFKGKPGGTKEPLFLSAVLCGQNYFPTQKFAKTASSVASLAFCPLRSASACWASARQTAAASK